MQLKKVLIAGAGPAGFIAARCLQRLGVQTDIIERRKTWHPAEGAGLALPGPASAILKKLELLDPIREKAHQVHEVEYTTAIGRRLSWACLDEGVLRGHPFLALPRRQLLELLHSTDDNIHYQTTISHLERRGDQMEVALSNGLCDRYDLVIGADGIHSSLRQNWLFPQSRVIQFPIKNWRALIPPLGIKLEPTYMIDNQSGFMLYPLKGGVYIYGQQSLAPSETDEQEDGLKSFIQAFRNYQGFVPHALKLLTISKTSVYQSQLSSLPNSYFYNEEQGPVVLIGDAAHGTTPFLQGGVYGAALDIYSLLSFLQHYPRDEALSRYAAHRSPQADALISQSNGILLKAFSDNSSPEKMQKMISQLKAAEAPLNVLGWRQMMANDPCAHLPPLDLSPNVVQKASLIF